MSSKHLILMLLRAAGYISGNFVGKFCFRCFSLFVLHFCIWFYFPLLNWFNVILVNSFFSPLLSPTSCFVNELIATVLCHPYDELKKWKSYAKLHRWCFQCAFICCNGERLLTSSTSLIKQPWTIFIFENNNKLCRLAKTQSAEYDFVLRCIMHMIKIVSQLIIFIKFIHLYCNTYYEKIHHNSDEIVFFIFRIHILNLPDHNHLFCDFIVCQKSEKFDELWTNLISWISFLSDTMTIMTTYGKMYKRNGTMRCLFCYCSFRLALPQCTVHSFALMELKIYG